MLKGGVKFFRNMGMFFVVVQTQKFTFCHIVNNSVTVQIISDCRKHLTLLSSFLRNVIIMPIFRKCFWLFVCTAVT